MKRRKLFILAIGDKYRASSRLRIWQNLDLFSQFGFLVRADNYNLSSPLYGRLQKLGRLFNFARKIYKFPVWLFQMIHADIIFFQETVILSFWIRVFKFFGKKVIYDFSDPLDHLDLHTNGLRSLYFNFWATNFKRNCSLSDMVIVENSNYSAANFVNSKKLLVLRGPIDTAYFVPDKHLSNENLLIGWTGSPMTISFLCPILPILDEIAKKRKIKLRLVGVKKIPMNVANIEVECIPWSIETESELVSEMDLGLFCLPNDASAEYRGGGKLFVYMASGVPFIATNKGVSAQIMRESNVGFPVNEITDWAMVLLGAIDDVDTRNKYAKLGRDFAIKFLSKEYYTDNIFTCITKIT